MFKIFKCDKGNNPIIKELPSSEGTFNVGDVATLTNGVITKATGSTKPQYVVAEKGTKAVGDVIAVNPIYSDMEFLVPLSAVGTALKVGNKVTIGADSDKVTATTSSGVATILEILGTAVGDEVIVKFE